MSTKPLLLLVVTWSIVAAPVAFADAWRNCGSDDVDLSIRSCSKVIKDGSQTKQRLAKAYYNRGTSYEDKNELDLAIADLSKAIELDPKYQDAYLNRGSCYDANGDYAKALADDDKAIELEPGFINAFDNRAQLYDSLGQYSRAIADYTKVIELNPKYGDLSRYYIRGLSRYYDGDFKGAAADFVESLRTEVNPNAMLHLYLARSRVSEPADSELEEHMRELDSKEWPFPVMELYLAKRSPESALKLATGDYDKCSATYYVGEWHLMKGDKPSAEARLRDAIASCPKDANPREGATAELKRISH
jgi:lipoprotein NlpI